MSTKSRRMSGRTRVKVACPLSFRLPWRQILLKSSFIEGLSSSEKEAVEMTAIV
jgi:hypothetical protein